MTKVFFQPDVRWLDDEAEDMHDFVLLLHKVLWTRLFVFIRQNKNRS